MRRSLVVAVLALASASLGAEGRGVAFGLSAGVYDPPGSAGAAPLVGAQGEYWLGRRVALAGLGRWSSYGQQDSSVTFVSFSCDGLLFPLRLAKVEPFVGVGVGVNRHSGGGEGQTTGGVEAVGGVAYRPEGCGVFVLEVRRRLENLSDTAQTGSWEWSAVVMVPRSRR